MPHAWCLLQALLESPVFRSWGFGSRTVTCVCVCVCVLVNPLMNPQEFLEDEKHICRLNWNQYLADSIEPKSYRRHWQRLCPPIVQVTVLRILPNSSAWLFLFIKGFPTHFHRSSIKFITRRAQTNMRVGLGNYYWKRLRPTTLCRNIVTFQTYWEPSRSKISCESLTFNIFLRRIQIEQLLATQKVSQVLNASRNAWL